MALYGACNRKQNERQQKKSAPYALKQMPAGTHPGPFLICRGEFPPASQVIDGHIDRQRGYNGDDDADCRQHPEPKDNVQIAPRKKTASRMAATALSGINTGITLAKSA